MSRGRPTAPSMHRPIPRRSPPASARSNISPGATHSATIERGVDVRLMLRGAVAPTSDFVTWLNFADEALSEAVSCGDEARITASLHRAWALNFASEPRDATCG